MRKFVFVLASVVFLSGLFLTIKTIFPHSVLAQCCTNGDCTPDRCGGADCPIKFGRCVSVLETCTSTGDCPTGETCQHQLCSGGGGTNPSCTTGCQGCYPNNCAGLHPVSSFQVKSVSSTRATINWAYGSGPLCTKYGSIAIFIGRNKSAVQNNCGFSNLDTVGNKNNADIDVIAGVPGIGGGGQGGSSVISPTSGAPYTGGGGGGAGSNQNSSGNGGSGIVIIRYPAGDLTATGGVVSTSGADKIHTFKSNGTFKVVSGSTTAARFLVVAGGGSGGVKGGGGGGAGGVKYLVNQVLAPGSYAVAIGPGGVYQASHTGSCNNPYHPAWQCGYCPGAGNGGATRFGTILATGGGGGGTPGSFCGNKGCEECPHAGKPGGSGGGATYDNAGYLAGGAGIAGQGNHGGASQEGSTWAASLGAGGGGGKNVVGQDGQRYRVGGSGGDGICTDISGVNSCYGGGGMGASGEFGTQTMALGCTWARTITDTSSTFFDTATSGISLAPGVTYYFKVIGKVGGTDRFGEDFGAWCGGAGAQAYCSALLSPSSGVIPLNQSLDLTTTVTTNETSPQVLYVQKDTDFTFAPELSSDKASLFKTTITGVKEKSPPAAETISAQVFLQPTDRLPSCVATGSFTVGDAISANPWWQVKNGDVSTGGDLKSEIPSGNVFDDAPVGGYPGVPAYVGNLTGITSTNVSATHWIANTQLTGLRTFDSQYFANLIPSDALPHIKSISSLDQSVIDGNTDVYLGYKWFRYDGPSNSDADLTLSTPLNLTTDKVILFVDSANFNIGSNINLQDGSGFFMVVVGKKADLTKGQIIIDKTVGNETATPDLEGIYIADDTIIDGTKTLDTPPVNDVSLYVRGSMVAYGEVTGNGFALQRNIGDIANTTTPSEKFEYAPDQIMLFPSMFGVRRINWKEVAP